MAKAIHHWINGKEVAGAALRKGAVFNPATFRVSRGRNGANREN